MVSRAGKCRNWIVKSSARRHLPGVVWSCGQWHHWERVLGEQKRAGRGRGAQQESSCLGVLELWRAFRRKSLGDNFGAWKESKIIYQLLRESSVQMAASRCSGDIWDLLRVLYSSCWCFVFFPCLKTTSLMKSVWHMLLNCTTGVPMSSLVHLGEKS